MKNSRTRLRTTVRDENNSGLRWRLTHQRGEESLTARLEPDADGRGRFSRYDLDISAACCTRLPLLVWDIIVGAGTGEKVSSVFQSD